MIVISLTDCPAKVRGDLSKWLIEINTGVYVGNINARVREELWDRICQNLKTGRATMVYSAGGEQHMEFRVHNTPWEPVDFEGLTLMRRPHPGNWKQPTLPENFSKAAKMQLHRNALLAKTKDSREEYYAVIDLETSGLSSKDDEIIEIAALLIEDGEIKEEFSRLVFSETPISDSIIALTGITPEERKKKGVSLPKALEEFYNFVGKRNLVCHNSQFDSAFLRESCRKCGIPIASNRYVDTLALSRRKLRNIRDYKLQTVAEALGIDVVKQHRALADCKTTAQVFQKLKVYF